MRKKKDCTSSNVLFFIINTICRLYMNIYRDIVYIVLHDKYKVLVLILYTHLYI